MNQIYDIKRINCSRAHHEWDKANPTLHMAVGKPSQSQRLGNNRKAKAVSLATAVLETFINSGLAAVLETFVNSGLAAGKYVRDVYAVAALWLESGVQFTVIAKNEVSKLLNIHSHAQENLLHALAMILSPADRISHIKLWIYFSPCWNCSEKIRQFLRGKNASTDMFPTSLQNKG